MYEHAYGSFCMVRHMVGSTVLYEQGSGSFCTTNHMVNSVRPGTRFVLYDKAHNSFNTNMHMVHSVQQAHGLFCKKRVKDNLSTFSEDYNITIIN